MSSSVGSSDEDARCGGGAAVGIKRIKKQVHNEVERRRKDKINCWILRIGDLLPVKDPRKQSKNGILERAVDYIAHLRTTNEKLLLDTCSETQAQEFQRLKEQIKELERQNSSYLKLLKTAGISPVTMLEDVWDKKAGKLSNKINPEQVDVLLSKYENGLTNGKKRKKELPVNDSKSVDGSKMQCSEQQQLTTEGDGKDVRTMAESSISFPPLQQESCTTQVSSSPTVVTQALPAAPIMSTSQNPEARENRSSAVLGEQSTVLPFQNKQLAETGIAQGSSIRPEMKPTGQVITIGTTTLLPAQTQQQQPWPSALLLPNGQIIPVVSQPSIVYTNPAPVVSNGLVWTQGRDNSDSAICPSQLGVILNKSPVSSTPVTTSVLPLVSNASTPLIDKDSQKNEEARSTSPEKKSDDDQKLKLQSNSTSKEEDFPVSTICSTPSSVANNMSSSPARDFHSTLENVSNSSSDGNSSKAAISDSPPEQTDILAKATESIFSSSLSDLSPSMPGFNGSDNDESCCESHRLQEEGGHQEGTHFAFQDVGMLDKERRVDSEQSSPTNKRLCTNDKRSSTENKTENGSYHSSSYLENRVSGKNTKEPHPFSIADISSDPELPTLILSTLEENEGPVNNNNGGLPFLGISSPDSHFHGSDGAALDNVNNPHTFGMMGNVSHGFCQQSGYGNREQVTSEACRQMRNRLALGKSSSLTGPKRQNSSEQNLNYTPPLSRPFLPQLSNSTSSNMALSPPFFQHSQMSTGSQCIGSQPFKQISHKLPQMNAYAQRPHSISNYSAEALIGLQTPVSGTHMTPTQNPPRIQCQQQQQLLPPTPRNLLPYSAESLLQSQPYSEKKCDGPGYCQPYQHTSQVSQHFPMTQRQSSPGNGQQQQPHNHFGPPAPPPPPLLMRHYPSPAIGQSSDRSNAQMYSSSFGLGVQNNSFSPHAPSLNCLQNLSSEPRQQQQQQQPPQQQQNGCLFPSDSSFLPLSGSEPNPSGRSPILNHFPQNHFFPSAPSLVGPVSPRSGFVSDPAKKDHHRKISSSPTKGSKKKSKAEEISYDRSRTASSYFSVTELSSSRSEGHFFPQRPQQHHHQHIPQEAPPYNPLFRPQSQQSSTGSLNLNFQPPAFSVNHIHRSTSSQPTSNLPSSGHHVPNFNLSNIFPDIGDSSPAKFPAPSSNHHLLRPAAPVGQMQDGGGTLAHHQARTAAPSLYHGRGFNGIHGFDARTASSTPPFNHAPATQSFGNVIPSLNFSVHDH